MTCIPQAYPLSLQAFDNSYLILTFSKPVKYTAKAVGGDSRSVIKLSVSGPADDYALNYSLPYWPEDSYQQRVFIQFQVNQYLNGSEKLYLYIDTTYVTDTNGHQILKSNATAQYLPLIVDLAAQENYIDAADRVKVEWMGRAVAIAMAFSVVFSLFVSVVSKGTMDMTWSFVSSVQILNLIPLMTLNYTPMFHVFFQYLGIANLNFSLLSDTFISVFNLQGGLQNDGPLNSNFG